MLTLRECLDYSELSDDEIAAIAEHEHVTEIVAAELGACLLATDGGLERLKRIVQDDIAEAESQGRSGKAERLRRALAAFLANHPPSASG